MAGAPTSDCERYRTDLSAFADETLSARRWEQVGYHVAGCATCREELAETRRVRESLGTKEHTPTVVSPTLEERLHDIAGIHVDAPLYMSGGPRCALPSRRKQRQRRLLRSSGAVVAVLASVLVIAFLVAPEPPTVSNAVSEAREQYFLSTTAVNVNEAVGAVLLAHERGATLGHPEHQGARSTMVSKPHRITRSTAAALLEGEGPTHSGTQRVWISDGESAYHVTDVQVDEVLDEGSNLVVLDASGERFLSWFVPSNVCCQSGDGPPWSFWQYQGMDQVAGRWANVVEARDAEDRRVARWWVDHDGGLVLWSERYDVAGKPTIISGYTSLQMNEAQLADDQAQLVQMAPVSSTGAREWCVGLEECPSTLGGLPLIARSSSEKHGGASLQLLYSDGFRSLSVVWSEGKLQGTTRTSGYEPGLPDVAVWQFGEGIISVTTNGSRELLHHACSQLPGERAFEPTVMERIGRGLSQLIRIN